MNQPIRRLSLISSTYGSDAKILSKHLDLLCPEVSLIDFNRWIKREILDSNGIIIFNANLTELSLEKTLSAMSATPNSTYFPIIHPPITGLHEKILDLCKDFCISPYEITELAHRLDRLQSFLAKNGLLHAKKFEEKNWADFNLIGKSNEFQKVLSFTKNAANCDAPVLIEGETGCGKEMIARAIHYLSHRMGQAFIPINCGAMPDHLIENELFGHEKGAYTDAKQNYIGVIEQANGGTLFLDEIEALSSKGQVTLLRFIEDKIIKPLGSQKSKKVNVRIIVASNVSLSRLAESNQFRKDLLFRLNLLHLIVPPLRMRENDIPYLTEFFMQKYRKEYQRPDNEINPKILEWMCSHDWPGNVRELENFIHRSFLHVEDCSVDIPYSQKNSIAQENKRRKLFDRRLNFDFDTTFAEAKANVNNYFEKQYLIQLISKTKGNVTQAAIYAEKERRALGKLLKKHKISHSKYHIQ